MVEKIHKNLTSPVNYYPAGRPPYGVSRDSVSTNGLPSVQMLEVAEFC